MPYVIESRTLLSKHCPLPFVSCDWGLDNLRASEPCEADVRGTQVSLKNTPVSLKSTQVSLNSSPVNLTVSIYVGGCSCLTCLACFVHASHVCLACLARLPRMPCWLALIVHTHVIAVFLVSSSTLI